MAAGRDELAAERTPLRALQGQGKEAMRRQVGQAQVHAWRRDFEVRPPALEDGDPRLPEHDPRYAKVSNRLLPRTESLADAEARVLPFWHERVEPLLMSGQSVLVCAHGNTLRGLVKYLDDLSDEAASNLKIPTGTPMIYDLDRQLHPRSRRNLG